MRPSWDLVPPGLGVGDSFRLLFVTSTGRNASSSNIADYSSFVQGRAAAGHSAVRSFSSKFRVLASTHSVDARDHTGTRYTSTNKGVPIYWLDGDKVADDYEDFYDGSWDNKSRKGKNESGNAFSNSSWIWSGTRNDGTESPNALGVNRVTRIRLSSGATLWADDGSAFLNSNSWSLFSLSPVITLVDEVAVLGVSISSTPANTTSGYAEGETIQVRIGFGESVSVTGTPYLVLDIAGAARRAAYASGSGTNYLNFEYTVQTGDFDSNGLSLCSSRVLDPGCGRISLNGGRISAQSDNLAAELDLPALGNQSGHKVDGMPTFVPDPGVVPMPSPSMGIVPRNWSLRPDDVDFGEQFRVLFITSTRNAVSSTIDDYNQHAINDAGAGHSAIRPYKDGFRVIASTATVDARDNAALTGTGERIYWLDGATQVADNYSDLFDGSWDSVSPFDRAGNSSSKAVIWTGSTNAGVAHSSNPLGSSDTVEVGGTRFGFRPLSGGNAHRSSLVPLYAISQVLMVPEQVTREPSPSGGHAPTSRPRQGDTYRLGETFIFPFTFTEPVVVRGVPTMPLELDSGTVRARYHSGSGTNTLLFAYTVQAGDYEESRSGALSGAHLIFAPGDSYMALDGASVRALADGSPALLVSAAAWSTAYGSSHKMEARPAFAKSASISSSPERGTTYGTGETITARLAMSEAVRVTGRPSIRLDVGGARHRANYVGPIGTATDALEFSYVVQSGDFDADGVTLCASGPGCGSIQLDGGTIRMVSRDVDANLVLPALAAQARHKVNAAEPLPTPAPACSAEIRVSSNWALKPSGVDAGGKFRLLFVSSNQAQRAVDEHR